MPRLFRSAATGIHYARQTEHSDVQARLIAAQKTDREKFTEGELRKITYRGLDGKDVKGWLILPVGYQEGRRYPLVTWVYAGTVFGDRPPAETSINNIPSGDDTLAKQLLAAHGYAVLLPSMPLPPFGATNDDLLALTNPNPQLKSIELGQASVYRWKDKEGKEWKGSLYKPSNYKTGQRYPLVIQTHGFSESSFRPSGIYPTAFAARALAATGIVVLQVQESCPPQAQAEEGPCAVAGYESGANQLVSDGLVDPEEIGIIGFSRTCFCVMETLTTGSLHLKAASITDGVMATYLQYMTWGAGVARDAEILIGAKLFGEGLQQWLKRSPGFNLDKVNAPLVIVAGEQRSGLLLMWEPYAGLRYLHKPVDLIILNTGEHVLTNPAVRFERRRFHGSGRRRFQCEP